MSNKILIGNLAWQTTEDRLKEVLEEYGEVKSVTVPTDPQTGRSRMFAIVVFATDEEASAAIDGLNNTEFDGRNIRVNLASI